jgi:hypothetical protein
MYIFEGNLTLNLAFRMMKYLEKNNSLDNALTLEFPNGEICFIPPNFKNTQKYIIEALIGEGKIKK